MSLRKSVDRFISKAFGVFFFAMGFGLAVGLVSVLREIIAGTSFGQTVWELGVGAGLGIVVGYLELKG